MLATHNKTTQKFKYKELNDKRFNKKEKEISEHNKKGGSSNEL